MLDPCPALRFASSRMTRSRGKHGKAYQAWYQRIRLLIIASPHYPSPHSLKTRAAKKIRLQLDDGIPLVIKYGWSGQTYTLEDCKFQPTQTTTRRICADLTFPPFSSYCLPFMLDTSRFYLLFTQLTTGTSFSNDSATRRRLTVGSA